MTTDTASTIGKLSALIVDPTIGQVLALRLRKTTGPGDTLHWEDLTAFGPDAVTIPTAAAVTSARDRAAELDDKAAELIGKRVLTDTGNDLGAVADIDFDPASGTIISLVTPGGPVYGDRLRGCGSYAVIVTDT
ncbi:PRC-barrel domain-containing protein [Longispora sp. NPDC051575]|uniref:PRC-barrel domain-containing protein n=1 Tax=Longispora sp. NPDC051575 TaxID=3154943 RepID=UPI0034238AEC